VKAVGLTKEQLQAVLVQKLADYVKKSYSNRSFFSI